MRSVLVSGGAGFIGANFVQYWLSNHPSDKVIVLDLLTYAGNLSSLENSLQHANCHFIHGDICSEEQVSGLLREHAITTIVHLAAESHVDRSIHGPDAFVHTNIGGTHELLKAARRVWLQEGKGTVDCRFHHVSTDEVYGSLCTTDPSFTETSPYRPNSPYAATKAASDHLVRAYYQTYDLPVTTTNCSNNYGPYQFPEKLIPLMLVNLLEGKPLPVYGDGQNIRDWLYVEDHCRAIDRVITRGSVGETYNVGGGNEWRNIDIVTLLCNLLDETFAQDRALASRFPDSPSARGKQSLELVTFVPDRPGHDRRYAIDGSKIRRELGFLPVETFDSGIRKTLSWYLANEPWWRAVMTGTYREWMGLHYGTKVNSTA